MGCFSCCACWKKSTHRVGDAVKHAEEQVGHLAHQAVDGAHRAADRAAAQGGRAAGEILSALAEPEAEEDQIKERLEHERTHSTAAPKWRLGMSRLAPPVPAKYNPDAYTEEGAGTRLDQMLSMKTTTLKQMEKELAFLKIQLDEAQQRFDVAMSQYQEAKDECDNLKKKKAHIRVFGSAQKEMMGSKHQPKRSRAR